MQFRRVLIETPESDCKPISIESPVQVTSFIDEVHRNLALKRIPTLDGLRALAVSLVIFYHFGFGQAPASLGLMMFFVLSGFLITWLLLKEQEREGGISLSGFYQRRTLRIFPAFYVYWVLVVIYLLVSGKDVLWEHAISSLFYVSNYYTAIQGDPSTAFSHTWSLGVEEQFYLLWPLLFIKLGGDLQRMSYFLYGLILTVWVHRFWRALGSTRLTLPLTLILLGSSIYLGELATPRYRDVIGFSLEPVLIATVLALVIGFATTPEVRWIEWPAMRYLGRISYSLYLYQQVTVTLPKKQLIGQPQWLQLIAALAFTLAAATASYYLIERPFMRLKDWSLWSKRRAA